MMELLYKLAEFSGKTAALRVDCGDNSCVFRVLKKPSGMRTNGGCRCWANMTPTEQRRWAQRAAMAMRTLDSDPIDHSKWESASPCGKARIR